MFFAPYLCLAAAAPLDPVATFAVYEPVTRPSDVDLLLRVRPDLVCRGWFKWGSSPRWTDYAAYAEQLFRAGVRLQGGITCAAIYPKENGIDDATFLDFTTHDPDDRPVEIRFSPGSLWYHLSLYNPAVRDYLKADVRRQLDAGAQGVWYDEIEGTYDWIPRTGYDRYACDAFRDWLIDKYVRGQGWSTDDPRWREAFGIDLSRYDGTIEHFDYRRWLHETLGADGKPLAAHPPQGDPRAWATSANPLYREWGFAWDRRAKGTFRFDTVETIFAELVADARTYARERYGREILITYNHNGTARAGADFLQPHYGRQPELTADRLDGRRSYLPYYEATIADAAEVAPQVPVVFFVDWPGETDRLTALPRSDQLRFLNLYVPEAYAAGGEFALPLRGYSYSAVDQDTVTAQARMLAYLREHIVLFRSSTAVAGRVVAPEGVTARLRRSVAGTTLHLINHRWDLFEVRPMPLDDLVVDLPAVPAPLGAFVVSTDWLEQRPVRVEAAGERSRVVVSGLTCNALVVFPSPEAWRRVVGEAGPGAHIQAVGRRAAAVAGPDGRFMIWPPAGEGRLRCLETGEERDAEDSVRFAPPPAGPMAVGAVLDEYGVPLCETILRAGDHEVRTDAWGRFAVPRAGAETVLTVPLGDGESASAGIGPGATLLRAGSVPWVVRGTAGLLGWWGNWPGRDPTADRVPVELSLVEAAGRTALEARFMPVPVAWVNANSARLAAGEAEAIELIYRGDGSSREVRAVFQVFGTNFAPPRPGDTFYSRALSLAPTEWTAVRLPFSEFLAPDGERLDTVPHGQVTFQFMPAGPVTEPVLVQVAEARLVVPGPALRVVSHDPDGTLDGLDLDDTERGHRPLQTFATDAGDWEVLYDFESGELPYLNWQGREAGGPVLLEGSFAPGPGGVGRCLRLVFAAGRGGWANANVPLPERPAARADGVALRLRANRDDRPVRVGLHLLPGSRPGQATDEFPSADVLVRAGEWTAVALPWSAFRLAGRPIDLTQTTRVNLQIVQPGGALEADWTVEVDDVGLWWDTER